MNRVLLFIWIAFGVPPASAAEPTSSDFCVRTRTELRRQFHSNENRIAFENDGGLFNGGVCWWHSRLQRSAIYLTRYAPEKQKPTLQEAETIIHQLTRFEDVVEIPGYENFYEFSRDHAHLIQGALNEWQIRDGFIHQQWIRGISGRSFLSPDRMEKRMNRIYEQFLKSEPGLWVMIQMRGITSHALLIIEMEKTEKGYELTTIDSNQPDANPVFNYQTGDTALHYGNSTFVPYAGFHSDLTKIHQALAEFCGN